MLMSAIIAFLSLCSLGLFIVFFVALADWMSDKDFPLPVVAFIGVVVPFASVISVLVYFIGPPPH